MLRGIVRRCSREDGIALIMAIIVLMILLIILAGALELSAGGSRSSSYRNQSQVAYNFAEAGVNNAVSVIDKALTDTSKVPSPTTNTFTGGSVTWTASYNSTTRLWTVTSVGTTANPTGAGTTPVTRTITATVRVNPPPYSFVALNRSSDNHTLIVRASGSLFVTNNMYINSSNDHDAFDMKGTAGTLSAPAIYTVGGWEYETTAMTIETGTPRVTCPLTGHVNATDPHTAGCPFTGQLPVDDPFAGTPTPALSGTGACTTALPAVNVSTKALSGGVATITTASAHGLVVNQIFTISIGDSRFDGTYSVTAVPSSTQFKYSPTGTSVNVTNASMAANVATITTASAHGLSVGDSVTVNIADSRFNGTFTVTAVPSSTTLKYALTPATTQIQGWNVTSNVATLTVKTPPTNATVGDTITVSGFGGGQAFLNAAGKAVTAVGPTSNTVSYALVHANGSGGQSANPGVTITAIASAAQTGTATLLPVVATTAASGTVQPTPSGGSSAPKTCTFTSGSQTLNPGTYYGGICVGAADCTGTNCAVSPAGGPYSPAQTLVATIAAGDGFFVASGSAIAVGDTVQVDSEQMTVTAVGNPGAGNPPGSKKITVTRHVNGTSAAAHLAGAAIVMPTPAAGPTVTLTAGTYVMAGGGFHICGNANLNAPNVLIYNTQAPSPNNTAGTAGAFSQFMLNTSGNVTIGPQTSGSYQGLTYYQDPSLAISPGTKCDGRTKNPQPDLWDFALSSMASVGANGALGSISGTIYAPHEDSLFVDQVGGTANLAVLTGCIAILGSQSTFDFQPTGLFSGSVSIVGQSG